MQTDKAYISWHRMELSLCEQPCKEIMKIACRLNNLASLTSINIIENSLIIPSSAFR